MDEPAAARAESAADRGSVFSAPGLGEPTYDTQCRQIVEGKNCSKRTTRIQNLF